MKKVNVSLVDDIDESEAQHTIGFSFEGVAYLIDLNDKHAQELREIFGEYVACARRATPQAGKTPKASNGNKPARRDPEQLAAIRDWARLKNISVSERGRIPLEVIRQWEEAHNTPAPSNHEADEAHGTPVHIPSFSAAPAA